MLSFSLTSFAGSLADAFEPSGNPPADAGAAWSLHRAAQCRPQVLQKSREESWTRDRGAGWRSAGNRHSAANRNIRYWRRFGIELRGRASAITQSLAFVWS